MVREWLATLLTTDAATGKCRLAAAYKNRQTRCSTATTWRLQKHRETKHKIIHIEQIAVNKGNHEHHNFVKRCGIAV